MIYYTLTIMFAAIANAIYNLAFHRRYLAKLPLRYRIIYAFIARPVRVSDYIRGKVRWWYPLSLCGRHKMSFNIYLNPPDVKATVLKALSKGCISKDDIVWSTYGIPAVPLLTIAYMLALSLGDEILLKPLLHTLSGG